MYNYYLYRLRIHPMLRPLYIKRTHNSIDHVTLLWDNFMYSNYFHRLRTRPMLRPLYIKRTHNSIDHVTLLWDNFMYSNYFHRLRTRPILRPLYIKRTLGIIFMYSAFSAGITDLGPPTVFYIHHPLNAVRTM